MDYNGSTLMEKPGVINGFLYCRKIGRDWKKRWCEIKNNKLFFYSTPTPNIKNETGFIRLEDVTQIIDSPSSQHPKIVDGEQKNHENCTFEMTFQQKTSTLFFSATSILFKEKWISSLTYSKYYYNNRLKIRNLFTAGLSWGLLLHGGGEPIGRKGFALSKLITNEHHYQNQQNVRLRPSTSNPNIRIGQAPVLIPMSGSSILSSSPSQSYNLNNNNNNVNNQNNNHNHHPYSVWMFGGVNSQSQLLCDLWELQFPNLSQENNNCGWVKHQIKGHPSKRSGHTITEYGKYLILFGGKTENGRSNELFFFDTQSMEWSTPQYMGSPPPPRDAHTAVIVVDNLFVFGGRNNETIFNDLFLLNLKTMRWVKRENKENQTIALCHHTCVTLTNSILLIFGGFDGKQPSNKIFIYNIKSDLWTQPNTKGALPLPRFLHSAIYVENQMIIYGGTNGKSIFGDMFFFMPETMYWHKIIASGISTPDQRFGHKMITCEKFHFLYGGNNDDDAYPNDLLFLGVKTMEKQWQDRMALGLGDVYCYQCDRKITDENSSQLVHLIHPLHTFHEDCFNHKLEEIIEENVLEIFNLPVTKQRITSDISYLLNYVRYISQQEEHPVALLIQKYIIEFNSQYVIHYGTDPTLLLQKALDDIHSFIHEYSELVISNIKLLDCAEGKLHCCIIAKKFILPNIFSSLFNIYLKNNIDADSTFTSITSKLQNITTKELHITNKFLIEFEEGREKGYKECITVFEKLIEYSDPYQKLDTLVAALHIAHYSISHFYSSQTKKKDVFITADDLVPLFQYFLIKSKISNIHSEIAFIQDFLDVSLLNGEAAYCLTTLQVAVSATERISLEQR